ncbi:MAG TPA: thiamine diphosphokinase [Iamia sp.]|nr:thiamine diphosphokinase [Iamia sp.]
MRTVLVVTGGDPPHAGLVLPPADLVVAADSGADHAVALGLRVDVLVGDLDSIDPVTLAAVRAADGEVVRLPRDKDATDVELALDAAWGRGAEALVLVGGHGGRLDHALATMGALASVAAPGRRVEAWMGPAHVAVTVDEAPIAGRVGELVSLVPLGGAVDGVTTTGLRWPLAEAHLPFGSTWGVSNEVVVVDAGVAVTGGVLAVVRPHALAPEHDDPGHVPRP